MIGMNMNQAPSPQSAAAGTAPGTSPIDPDLYELLQNADPDTLQQMIAALSSGEMMGMGGEMFQTPQPSGQSVGPHNVYVAASPLEHAAAAAKQGLGAQMMKHGQQARGTGIEAYINALRSGRPPQPQPPGMAVSYPLEDNTGP